MGVNSLPIIITRQRRDCDLKPGLSAPESSTLTTRLPVVRSQSISFGRPLGPQQQTRSSSLRRPDGTDGTDGRTDGRTPDRCIDSAPHTMRAVPKMCLLRPFCWRIMRRHDAIRSAARLHIALLSEDDWTAANVTWTENFVEFGHRPIMRRYAWF